MQRVVRLSLAGLLTFAGAGLTACGDKVTVPPATPVDSTIHSVTVSPQNASVAVGQTTQLAVTVEAGTGATVRTVTWSTSDATIATVDQTGKVTGVKGGATTIIAKSTANASVSGAASVTVTGGGVPTVTIQSIVQTSGGTSGPADLSQAKGQLDITLNVEANGQTIKTVTATITCGTKSKSASQTISDVAPSGAASSAVPITLQINTAAFNATTGVPDLNNGNCTLSSVVTTGTGTQSAQNSSTITLANTDVVIVKTTNSGNSAADVNGAFWKSGNVTVSATPVLYSGTTIASANITLPNATAATQTGIPLTAGVASATWSGTATSGFRTTGQTLGTSGTPIRPTVAFVDSQGNVLTPAQANAFSESDIRIDNQAPVADTTKFVANTQNTAGGWIGANFTFTDGTSIILSDKTKADNGGVDKVTFTTQQAASPSTTSSTFTAFASPANLAETSTSVAYDLRLNICDALQNCAPTGVLTTFGVDKTKPSLSQLAGPANNSIFKFGASIPDASFSVIDTSATAGVSGSGPGTNALLVSIQGLNPDANSATGSKTTCPIGVKQGSGNAVTCKSPAGTTLTFTPTQTAGEYTMVVSAVDQAGNSSDAITTKYYVDQQSPVLPAGAVDQPNNGTTNGSSTFTPVNAAADSMDIAAGNGNLVYPAATFLETGTAATTGVAFDNALVRSSKVTVNLTTTFFRSLAAATGGVVPGTAGAVPTTVGIRVIDAAGNLSTSLSKTLDPLSLAAGVAISNSSTTNGITNFTLDSAVKNPVAAGAATTFFVNAKAAAVNSGNPFAGGGSVCFYFAAPNGLEGGAADASGAAAGELVKIGCTINAPTTGVFPNRNFVYSFPWSPPARFNGTTVTIRAVGITPAGDAIITDGFALQVSAPVP